MSTSSEESFNLTRILQRWKWPRTAKPAFDDSQYTDLLRYVLQLAAGREIAAGVLAELSALLERNAPPWYADEAGASGICVRTIAETMIARPVVR